MKNTYHSFRGFSQFRHTDSIEVARRRTQIPIYITMLVLTYFEEKRLTCAMRIEHLIKINVIIGIPYYN